MTHLLASKRRSIAAIAAMASTLFAPLALGVAAPAQAQAAGDLTAAVGALRAISTMTANFTQTDRNGQSVGGVLTLKRPGRIRFQYQKGVPMLIVSDGSALTFVDYQVRQVQRWPIKNSPLGALLDPNRDVMKFGRLQPTGDPKVVSVEVRDKTHPEYGVITLVFVRNAAAPGGMQLSSWVSLDSQNNRTTVRLANQRYGASISDNDFRFNDPRKAGGR